LQWGTDRKTFQSLLRRIAGQTFFKKRLKGKPEVYQGCRDVQSGGQPKELEQDSVTVAVRGTKQMGLTQRHVGIGVKKNHLRKKMLGRAWTQKKALKGTVGEPVWG